MDTFALAMQIVEDLISQGYVADEDEQSAIQVVYINLENENT
jgi:hypothetical protein